MCLGGGGDGGAAEARAEEQRRQRMIEQANKRIEQAFAPFEGREWAFNPDQYQQARQQYQQELQQFENQQQPDQPQGLPFGRQSTQGVGQGNTLSGSRPLPGGPANLPPAVMDQMDPGVRDQLRGAGMNIAPDAPNRQEFFGWQQTGDNLYDQAKQSYLDYYMPQVDEQYEDYQEQQVYDLANRGLLASTVAGEEKGDLQTAYNRSLDTIRNRANEHSNTIRGNVVDAKSNLRALAQSGASPGAVASQAAERAQVLGEQPALDPLGDLFSQFAIQQQNRAGAGAGAPRRQDRTPSLLFNNPSGRSVRNVS